VVAAEELRAVAGLVHRRAPELAAPDDERVVEQPALLQIGHQRVDRPVGLPAQVRQLLDDVLAEGGAVGVPAAVIELHEAHAALDQPPRQQAVVGERGLPGWCRTARGSPAARPRDRSAPARSSACGRPSRRRRCASRSRDRPRLSAQAVEIVDGSIERRRTPRVDALGVRHEQAPARPAAELDALVRRRQEAAAPARLAAIGIVLAGEQHHEAGQIGVLAAEAVGEPGAHARAADHLVPVFMKICAGAWLNCVVCIERTMARSSAIVAGAAAVRRSQRPTGRASGT
jgi:hypothetical protein